MQHYKAKTCRLPDHDTSGLQLSDGIICLVAWQNVVETLLLPSFLVGMSLTSLLLPTTSNFWLPVAANKAIVDSCD